MRTFRYHLGVPVLWVAVLSCMAGGTAMAHPHPGGIVARKDGTVIVGDILQPRLLVIEPSGKWHEIRGVGFPRELELAADGTIYGATVYGGGRGQGLWKLGADEKPVSFLSDFYGLFTRGEDGTVVLAPADAQERRPRLERLTSDGRRATLATLEQINALAWHAGAIVVADRSAIRTVELDGAARTVADEVGNGIQGLAVGPNGPVVAAFDDRAVVEVARDGTRRMLLKSEAPWGPTDVTFLGDALYVVEYASPPYGWKGPRVRRITAGEEPVVLLTIEDGDSWFWLQLGLWTVVAALAATAAICIARGSLSRWLWTSLKSPHLSLLKE